MAEAKLLIQTIAGVTIVDFSGSTMLDGATIEGVGEQLYELVDQQARRKIVLGFSPVRFLSSTMLGVLIALRKKSEAIKGRLAIAGLRPELRRVFKISRIEKLFDFYDDQQAATDSFSSLGSLPSLSYLAAVFRSMRLALAAACSWVRPFPLSRMMILTWASVAVMVWPPRF